jgi:NADH-quinone oxidoreductase subunit J
MLDQILPISLIFLMVLLALLTIELKDMFYAIICFCGMSITIGALFWLLNAPYVSVFQLLIYAGAITVLFITTIMLTKRKEQSEK